MRLAKREAELTGFDTLMIDTAGRLHIDEASDAPAYQQIAAQLQAEIERGERAPGARLPAIRSLAAELGLHRDTVALAYEQLGQSGLVEARIGAGTFVRPAGRADARGAGRRDAGRRSDGVPDRPAAARAAEIELVLAPPVERLIALENTHAQSMGQPLSAAYTRAVAEIARDVGVPLHVDGARLFNAAVALGTPARELLASADSASFCLSKGLACPVGSIVVGDRANLSRLAELAQGA